MEEQSIGWNCATIQRPPWLGEMGQQEPLEAQGRERQSPAPTLLARQLYRTSGFSSCTMSRQALLSELAV